MSDVCKSKVVKTRNDCNCEVTRYKNHRGFHCKIKRGQLSEVCHGIFEGEPYNYRLCMFHAAVSSAIYTRDQSVWDEGIHLENLHEYVNSGDFTEWKEWLSAIRAEYRRLKAKSAERKK